MINLIRKSFLLVFITWSFISNPLIKGNLTKNISGETASWENRVLKGFPCTTEQFPFVVLIVRVGKTNELSRVCGGSLLSDKFILTAAHCLEPYRLAVLIGLNAPDQNPIRREVEDKIAHPHFDRPSLRNDIALLLLDESVPQSDHVVYAHIPNSNYTSVYWETKCRRVLVMGWGYTNDSEDLDDVDDLPSFTNAQCAVLPIISNQKCKRLYSAKNEVFDEHFCTLSIDGKDSCQGDSGGPLICDTIQIGIISWGLGCGKKDSPAVYIRIDKYLDFIDTHLSPSHREAPDPDASCKIKYSGTYTWFYRMILFLYLVTKNINVF